MDLFSSEEFPECGWPLKAPLRRKLGVHRGHLLIEHVAEAQITRKIVSHLPYVQEYGGANAIIAVQKRLILRF